jgi:hypothetical protein
VACVYGKDKISWSLLRFKPGADLIKTSLSLKHLANYLLVFLTLMVACDSPEVKPVDIGLNYFPLQTGSYQIYTVEEILYSEIKATETLLYQLKVEAVDSFPNLDATYTYVFNRSKRDSETEPWRNLDTWSVRSSDRELVVNEGNVPYVKLIFPLKKELVWNGNKYNTLPKDDYMLATLDEPFVTSGMTFDQTLQVIQEDNQDFIVAQDKRTEVYARNVGLIYKETTQLKYCTKDNCTGQQIIESGVIYKQAIIQYGNR